MTDIQRNELVNDLLRLLKPPRHLVSIMREKALKLPAEVLDYRVAELRMKAIS